ncbi:membrane protein [Porphyromonas macacae]|uniref:Membrane protein n=2 Tax=Porphyromonas macacae TaxID=28115 RepID=A0A0A2EBP3_9PORP|nr:DUF3098 domain-containing protein [Porphyromonas macacae]KGN76311.1 membrane protein [Porphyromonas macacae]
MLYGKKNYFIMGLSVLLIILGFILMSGGRSVDGITYNPEIFSARRIVVAPIVCLSGFFLMIYAILVNPDKKEKK